jgi:hypothetical protein
LGCFASDLDPLARPPLHAHGDRGTVKDGSLFQGYTIAQSVTGAHGSSFAAPVFGVATVVNRANGGGLVAGSEFLCTQIVFRDRNHPIVRGMWLLSWRDAGRYLTRLMPPRSKDPFGGKLAIVAKGWADYVPLALFEPSLLVRLPGSTATDPTGGDSNMVDVAGLIRLIPNRCLQFTIFAPGITIPNVMKQLDLEETGHSNIDHRATGIMPATPSFEEVDPSGLFVEGKLLRIGAAPGGLLHCVRFTPRRPCTVPPKACEGSNSAVVACSLGILLGPAANGGARVKLVCEFSHVDWKPTTFPDDYPEHEFEDDDLVITDFVIDIPKTSIEGPVVLVPRNALWYFNNSGVKALPYELYADKRVLRFVQEHVTPEASRRLLFDYIQLLGGVHPDHFGQVLYKQVLQQAVPQGVTNFANTRVVLTGVALSEVMSLNTESDWTSDGGHREVIRVELSDNADVNRVLGGKDGWEIPPTKFTPTGKIKLVAAQHNGFLLTCGADNAVDLKGPNYLEYDLETKVLTLQISLAYFSRGQTFKRGYNLIGNPPSPKHDYDMIQRKWRKTTDFSNTIAEVRQRYS